ncbi:MAG: hydrogenase maturation nickel metallochaperone HypA [Planctomycetaceae bacterium]|nr:hydrogenase maturation nickel metallochaperone HypA [Planctomycetaceae bacterium]
MHEAMVAESIIDSILSQVPNKHGRVIRVVISCGQINAINDEAMKFAFDIAAEETICKDAKLKIKHIPLKATCENCSKKFNYDLYDPCCPKCSKNDIKIGEDAPLLLEEIEFEEN